MLLILVVLSLLLLVARHATACSMAIPKGFKVTNLGIDSDSGLLPEGKIRLEITEYIGDTNFGVNRRGQAILDIHTGNLQKHDSDLEFMPYVMGYVANTAMSSGSVTNGTANVSWSSSGTLTSELTGRHAAERSALFSIPGATEAFWWFSARLGKVCAVYKVASGALGLAVCSNVSSVCAHETWSTAPDVGFSWPYELSDEHDEVMVWDEEQIVGLPLMCCICRGHEYFTYRLLENGKLSLTAVEALNVGMESAIAYDTSQDRIWEASGTTGYDEEITVRRESYAQGVTITTQTQSLSSAKLAQVVDGNDEGLVKQIYGLPMWSIIVIAVVAILAVIIITAFWLLRTWRGRASSQQGKQQQLG